MLESALFGIISTIVGYMAVKYCKQIAAYSQKAKVDYYMGLGPPEEFMKVVTAIFGGVFFLVGLKLIIVDVLLAIIK